MSVANLRSGYNLYGHLGDKMLGLESLSGGGRKIAYSLECSLSMSKRWRPVRARMREKQRTILKS